MIWFIKIIKVIRQNDDVSKVMLMQMVTLSSFVDQILGTGAGTLEKLTNNIGRIILPYVVYNIFLFFLSKMSLGWLAQSPVTATIL